MHTSVCDVLMSSSYVSICEYTNTPKYNQVVGHGYIVTRRWVFESHRLGKRIPEADYALDDRSLLKASVTSASVSAAPNRRSATPPAPAHVQQPINVEQPIDVEQHDVRQIVDIRRPAIIDDDKVSESSRTLLLSFIHHDRYRRYR